MLHRVFTNGLGLGVAYSLVCLPAPNSQVGHPCRMGPCRAPANHARPGLRSVGTNRMFYISMRSSRRGESDGVCRAISRPPGPEQHAAEVFADPPRDPTNPCPPNFGGL